MDGVRERVARADRPGFSPLERNQADLAHHLANLAQVVNGYLELAAMQATDETMERYIGNARVAAQQICELAHRLQDAED